MFYIYYVAVTSLKQFSFVEQDISTVMSNL